MRRLRPRASKALLLFAVALAGAATVVLQGHLERLEAAAAAAGPSAPAVVAAGDLPRGTVLQQAHLRGERVAVRSLPPGALGSVAEAVGRTLAADVVRGEVLTEARLGGAGGRIGSLVAPGMRAVIVEADLGAGMVEPGDRVDVLAVPLTGTYARLVVQEAEVLQVGASSAFDGGMRTTLVLHVSPSDAGQLAVARVQGEVAVSIAPAA